jgi:hypothetical protein
MLRKLVVLAETAKIAGVVTNAMAARSVEDGRQEYARLASIKTSDKRS